MKRETDDVIMERLVTDGWAQDGVTFRNEDREYIIVTPSDVLAFGTKEDVEDFVRVVTEMMKGIL